MERRYQLFATGGVRNITEYNQKVAENNADKNNSDDENCRILW